MQRDRGQCFIQVEAAVVDRMRAMRRAGESYSEVICGWRARASPNVISLIAGATAVIDRDPTRLRPLASVTKRSVSLASVRCSEMSISTL